MGTTIILGLITSLLLLIISFFYLPLPGESMNLLRFKNFYKIGIIISILIGLIFLSYFGIRFSGEKETEEAKKLQEVIYKEYELESLGGKRPTHSLGTPLATISVVAKELKKEIGDNNELSKDIDLLISQSKRCSEILKGFQKQIEEDKFFSSTKLEDLLEEIINFLKKLLLKLIVSDNDKNKIDIQRSAEMIYGLRNFIGNAIKFSKSKVNIFLMSNDKEIKIIINDDGPDSKDIISKLGEPYIKSRSLELNSNSGLGLGTF